MHAPAGYTLAGEGAESSPLDNGALLKVPVVLDGQRHVTLAFTAGR